MGKVRPKGRWPVSLLIGALVLTFGVKCVPIAQLTPVPVADCPMELAHPCCVTDAERVEQGSIVKQFVLDAPSAPLVATLFDEDSIAQRTTWLSSVDVAPLKKPDVPTYLLDSTFRL